jgi:hypothetical protein
VNIVGDVASYHRVFDAPLLPILKAGPARFQFGLGLHLALRRLDLMRRPPYRRREAPLGSRHWFCHLMPHGITVAHRLRVFPLLHRHRWHRPPSRR